jgi:predicted SprT family Zn-dependent metalloprotease
MNIPTQRSPTAIQFTAYQKMFQFLNKKLFGGRLPPVILNFSRMSKTLGFFAPERWTAIKGKAVRHEISLNPSRLRSQGPQEVASTLAHEMAHLWQTECGTPSRRGYHNAEWAAKMEEIGLIPSDTAQPGGARVGQKVSHYIDPAGAFAAAFKEMPRDYLLPWSCEEPEANKKKAKGEASKNKIKYSCPGCGSNVWGKPGLAIKCEDCEESYAPELAAVGAAA